MSHSGHHSGYRFFMQVECTIDYLTLHWALGHCWVNCRHKRKIRRNWSELLKVICRLDEFMIAALLYGFSSAIWKRIADISLAVPEGLDVKWFFGSALSSNPRMRNSNLDVFGVSPWLESFHFFSKLSEWSIVYWANLFTPNLFSSWY